MSSEKKKPRSYKRDENGNLMCDKCEFRPKPTAKYPHGNPGTLHYHMKSKHEGDLAHVCQHCQRGFLHKLTLDTHIAARHLQEDQKKNVEYFTCPVENCDFKSLTKANRRIHFLRKHCQEVVAKYMQSVNGEKDSQDKYSCNCCSEIFKSSTAFHYHIGKCLVDHNIAAHPLLESIC